MLGAYGDLSGETFDTLDFESFAWTTWERPGQASGPSTPHTPAVDLESGLAPHDEPLPVPLDTEPPPVASSSDAVVSTAHIAIPFASEDERWQAVMSRDNEADGWFVYCVLSTKCACRATCAARRPARKSVRFYDLLSDAVDAGFRPCKRCKPQAERDPTNQRRDDAVTGACRAMEEAAEQDERMPALEELARSAGLSAFHFHRMFRAQVGKTPKKYAKELLGARRGRR